MRLSKSAKQYIALTARKRCSLRAFLKISGIATKFLAKGLVSIEYQLFTAIYTMVSNKTG